MSEGYAMIALDIETMPNKSIIPLLPEPDVKIGNIKDEAKIRAKKEAAKKEQINKMALNPLYSRIASCAFYGDGNIDECHLIDADNDEAERELLDKINHRIDPNRPEICTWNGNNFDMRFIYIRAMILNIKMEFNLAFWTKRYSTMPHCDLMQVWCGWYGYEKLNNVASILLGENKEEFDVTTIKDIIFTPEGRKNLDIYNRQDTKLTYAIWYRMKGCLI